MSPRLIDYTSREPEDLAELGLEELLSARAVVVVEWGERLPAFYRRDALIVRFHDIGEGSRRIELLPAAAPTKPPRGDA